MKLSEAIRLGAMLKPQIIGNYFNDVGTCALGGAYDAIGKLMACGSDMHSPVWPLIEAEAKCPACKPPRYSLVNYPRCVGQVITHLNDDHRWTREQIADWVATVEPQDAAVEPVVERTAVRV